jgi:hypothetical protein
MAGRLRERRSKEVWQRSFATPRLREIACFDEIKRRCDGYTELRRCMAGYLHYFIYYRWEFWVLSLSLLDRGRD